MNGGLSECENGIVVSFKACAFRLEKVKMRYRCTCNETNLIHYLSSVYSVTIPLHASGLIVPHHQDVKDKGKAHPLQAMQAQRGLGDLRVLDFLTSAL
jgi:hypothetical protein